MTNHGLGSSLFQARKKHYHRHAHLHDHKINHVRSHEDIHNRDAAAAAEEEEAPAELERRVVEVVTTVSVVQYVDGDGNSIDVSTLFTPPKTDAPDGVVALTVDASVDISVPTVSVPGVSAVLSGVESLIGASAAPTESVTVSTSSQDPALTSAPSTTSSLFPSLGTITNSSSSMFSVKTWVTSITNHLAVSTAHSFSNSTLAHSLFANSTRTSSTFSSLTSSSSHSTRKSKTSLTSTSTWYSSSSTDFVAATGGAGSGDGFGIGTSTPTATAAATGGSDGDSGPETSQVVGGVVGGVAGLAILVLLAMLVLKWKKRHGGHILLGDGPSPNSRALPAAGPSSGGDGGAAEGVAERSLPFAVPSTLAALSGYKRSSKRISSASDAGEKGFHRVSGRKLPSVLQYGGDGYNDPRESAMSDTSSYRDSMAFFNQPGTQRFALGSPMRPESGIQVMREGPQRTPVTEQGPFYDQLTPPLPASPGNDPLGRSLVRQDGSRGSGSRFTENM